MCDHPWRAGCVTVPLFHCLFHDSTSITHFLHDLDPALCRVLPHTYAVCIADNNGAMKTIPAGFFIKTS